jgi:flavin reductase (DIM6/NTAB) family NADH-FMN oxidoreductase RutF
MVRSSILFNDLRKLDKSVFSMLDDEWMLVTAGSMQSFNTMTASWGGFGVLWNKPVAYVFVRPTRYTYRFMEQSEVFSLTFFKEKHRQILQFCGKYSGRDTDKIEKTGLIALEAPSGSVIFKQSSLAFDCRKIYSSDIEPSLFLDPAIEKNYPVHDYHRMYIGEITALLTENDIAKIAGK